MFSYFELVKRTKDESDMAGFRSFDNRTCQTVLDTGGGLYLRLTVIKFGMNDGSGRGRGCFGIEVTVTGNGRSEEITARAKGGYSEVGESRLVR